jgi:hypothetical protein
MFHFGHQYSVPETLCFDYSSTSMGTSRHAQKSLVRSALPGTISTLLVLHNHLITLQYNSECTQWKWNMLQGVPDETPNAYHVSVNGLTITSCPVDGCPYRSHQPEFLNNVQQGHHCD